MYTALVFMIGPFGLNLSSFTNYLQAKVFVMSCQRVEIHFVVHTKY